MIEQFKRVLVLSPHTNDGEFGAGGLTHRLVKSGASVYYTAFSGCEESVPDGYLKDILRQEVFAATNILGIPRENTSVMNYKVRRFSEMRQEILEDMVTMRAKLQPDLVLLLALTDLHQDHGVIAIGGARAFKFATSFHYKIPWNEPSRTNNVFVTLQQQDLSAKMSSISAYQSQCNRRYADPDVIEGLARLRGVQAGVEFSEAFEVGRWHIN